MKPLQWNGKRILATLFFGVATFAICFVLGYGITMALGPGTSGVLTIVFTTVLVVCAARITEIRGAFTIMVALFTILAMPTNLFGPAGWHKIVIGITTGLVYDVIWELLKRKKWSLPIAAAISTAVSIVLIWQLMIWLKHPKAEYLTKYIKYMIPVYGILGFFSAILGNYVYKEYFSKRKIVASIKE